MALAFSIGVWASCRAFLRVAISWVQTLRSCLKSLRVVRSSRHFLSVSMSSWRAQMFSGAPLLSMLLFTSSGFSRMSLMSNMHGHEVDSLLWVPSYLTCDEYSERLRPFEI